MRFIDTVLEEDVTPRFPSPERSEAGDRLAAVARSGVGFFLSLRGVGFVLSRASRPENGSGASLGVEPPGRRPENV